MFQKVTKSYPDCKVALVCVSMDSRGRSWQSVVSTAKPSGARVEGTNEKGENVGESSPRDFGGVSPRSGPVRI